MKKVGEKAGEYASDNFFFPTKTMGDVITKGLELMNEGPPEKLTKEKSVTPKDPYVKRTLLGY